MPRVFLITGASRGLGHAMAQTFLSAGEHVVATTRDPTNMTFTDTTPSNYLALKLDVTIPSDIASAFTASIEKFGRIDVVVNNAANGLIGPLETLTDEQVKQQFDTNFFSAVGVTRKAVETMRQQSPPGGRVLQIGTVTMLFGYQMVGAMCASKCALEAITQCLAQEMKSEWDIKLTTAIFGGLATNAHDKSMVFGEIDVTAYDHMNGREFVNTMRDPKIFPVDDPAKAAKGILALSKMENPPSRAFFGKSVFEAAKQRLKADQELLAREDIAELANVFET
ncbi:oxidoreductase domain-containing protein [Byssothecium circinans]|uniref:Oxidoreductase domain-containing protein n=1 Tax=Byssothecium circinans TaxID=147558 RepID=A0A6A5U786_9PLEO|nr:oxidoreductase domain-containing protein [Byssothecium circinans]